jgi:hypothetical protein
MKKMMILSNIYLPKTPTCYRTTSRRFDSEYLAKATISKIDRFYLHKQMF